MSFKEQIWTILFRTDTKFWRIFDEIILVLILISIGLVMLESVEAYAFQYKKIFLVLEWIITILFTIEYGLRIWSARKPKKYAFSFYGVVDLISILPAYLWLVITWVHALWVVRALRLLRIFRILKMSRYISEGNVLIHALRSSWHKISVFLMTVVLAAIIAWSIMYLVEWAESGFTSIPRSVYRAIVTITTVGYGDISPVTPLGQFLASILMIIWYGVIAVPTGIVSAQVAVESVKKGG